uniref:Filamin binding LIM protein 1 n=1 Tax=Corvus moneduloides TaxID=1196302 RepID=A0A8U7N9D2_CORMO
MLPGKAEKRIASSIFITLVPPRRDVATKEKTQREPQPDGGCPWGADCVCSPLPGAYQCCLSPLAMMAFAFGAGQQALLQSCWGVIVTGCYHDGVLPDITDPLNPPHLSVATETHPVASVPSSPPVLTLSEVPQPLSAEALGLALQQLDIAAPATLQLCTGSSPLGETEARSSESLSLLLADICAFCHKVLGPQEPTVEAMRKQYHPDCFTCRTCHRLLAGQRYFQRDGCPMCDTCFQATLEKCAKCQGLITEHIIRALGKGYHPSCFSCAACSRAIGTESFAVDEQGDVYCVPDFYRKYAAVCSACERPIVPHEDEDTYKIECLGRSFHESCYRCESCRMPLSPELTENGCYPLDDHLLCKSCHVRWRNESSC